MTVGAVEGANGSWEFGRSFQVVVISYDWPGCKVISLETRWPDPGVRGPDPDTDLGHVERSIEARAGGKV
jgi:hypothetical protein